MANYTTEIAKMLNKILRVIATKDQQGFDYSGIPSGLGLLQIYVLNEIYDKNLNINELVRITKLNRNTINSIISKLSGQKLIEKSVSENDARCQILSLTEEGEAFVTKMNDERIKLLDFMLDEVTINEERTILRFLSKYNQYHFQSTDRDLKK